MKRLTTIASGLALAAAMLPAVTFAAPPEITEEAFVCPVITTENVTHSPISGELSAGHYTIGGPDVVVPVHATNDDGAGTPGGDHAAPGNPTYTAIWSGLEH
jgi:hypothetical protein